MPRRHIWMYLCALLVGLSLALAPASLAYAGNSTHHTTHHKPKPKHHKPKPKHHKAPSHLAAGTPKNACTFLHNDTGSAKLQSTMESALETGNFPAAKTALLSLFNQISADASTAEADLSSAPSNVQAAFKTLVHDDQQFKTTLESATSLTQLESDFVTLGQTPGLQSASETVGNYATTLCGATTTTTPTVP